MPEPRRIEMRYRPQGPVLERYIAGKARREFIMGPLGSGKTNGSCWKAFRAIIGQAPNREGVRKSRGYAVRNTYPDLMGTTAKDWRDMFGEEFGRFVEGGLEPPTHHMEFNLEDGTRVEAEVVFIALDRPEHVRKIRGSQLTWAWINEVKELNKQIVDMLDLRVGRYPSAADGGPSWFGIFGDTNAPDEDHWYYRLAEEEKPAGWVFHRQPGGVVQVGTGDTISWVPNPGAENLRNLPKGYYEDGCSGKTIDWIKVNLANEYGFVQDGKPVYPEYVDSVHCRSFELVPSAGLWVGLDFGLTPAAVFAQRMVTGQWRWHRELVTTDTGVIAFAGLLKQDLATHYQGVPIHGITGDPAGDQRQGGDSEEKVRTVFQILAANGVEARPAHTNNFTKRREAVAAALSRMIDGAPGLLVHPQCKTTRKGMAGAYRYRRVQVTGDERFKDEPDKNGYSHPCEAGQYLMMGAGEGRAVVAAKRASPLPTVAITDYQIFG
jgi:hypothetical protein